MLIAWYRIYILEGSKPLLAKWDSNSYVLSG